MPTVVAPVIPDVLGDVRTWLKALPSTQTVMGSRWFFAYPLNATFPAGRIIRSGGSTQPGADSPVRNVRLMLEIASSSPTQFAAISTVSDTLEGELFVLTGPIGDSTFVLHAQVNTAFDSADPETLAPRKFLDVTLTVKAQ